MSIISQEDIKPEPSKKKWVVRFLNLPSEQQVDFLYRSYLADEIRTELEQLVLSDDNENHDKRGE